MLPDPSLILLVGPSGSGKSTFAQRHFLPTEIVSSDRCRALISDNEGDQTATAGAFQLLRIIVRSRLKRRRTTVVDATNLKVRARQRLLPLAFQFNLPAFAVVFQLGQETCAERNATRSGRSVPSAVLREQQYDLEQALPLLSREGFRGVYVLREAREIDQLVIVRELTQPGNSGPLS